MDALIIAGIGGGMFALAIALYKSASNSSNFSNLQKFILYISIIFPPLNYLLFIIFYFINISNNRIKPAVKQLKSSEKEIINYENIYILVALLLSIVIIVPTLLNFLKNGFYVKNIENNITEISKVDNLNWFQYSIYRNGEIINIQNQKLPTTKFKQIKFYEEINNPLFIINDRFVVDKSNKLKIGNRNENINFTRSALLN